MTDKLPPKIFVIEKDDLLRMSLCNTIERYWFNVLRGYDADSGMRLIPLNKPNIIIISTNLFDTDVIAFIDKLQKNNKDDILPIILIIGEDENPNSYKIIENSFLEIVKRPYTPNQLMTSIKSLLRKSKPVFQDRVIKYKDLSMDLATFKITRGNKTIHLGPTEFKILQLLTQSPKYIFSRKQIVDYVWGVDQVVEARTVDVHVNRLRSLIKLPTDIMPFIKTVRAAGYCLNLPGEID